MKKIFLGMLAAAGLLLVASCSEEEINNGVQQGDEATVSFTIGLDGVSSTRAISDGLTANQLTYALYTGDGKLVSTFEDSGMKTISTTFPTTVTLTLAKDQSYKVAFWAQNSACNAYTVTAGTDAMTVTVSYASAANNDETRDAFYATTDKFEVKGSTSMDVILKRPFAQINVGVTEADWKAAVASGITISTSSVVIKNAGTQIDLLTGNVSGEPVEVTYAAETIPATKTLSSETGETLSVTVDNVTTPYKWLSMSYILVNDTSTGGAAKTTLESLAYTFTPSSGTAITFSDGLTSVPVQRNYRTNIIGQILTGNVSFNISIDPIYNTPDYIVEEWDGKTTTAVTAAADGVYYVSTASELAWIAEQVNGGNSSTASVTRAGDYFKDVTIKLTDDIYLNDQVWTPIGTLPNGQNVKQNQDSYATYGFQGTFDGDGYTIYGLNANSNNATGLFGALYGTVAIKNVTVDGATVTSNRYAGVIAGYYNAGSGSSLTISGCTVKNASVTAYVEYTTKDDGTEGYDNGDKVGGIIGHSAGYSQTVTIENCSVENTSLTAYRDIGGIIGNATGTATTVSNNTVTGISLIVDATYNYNSLSTSSIDAFNVGEILGRDDKNEITLSGNSSSNVTSGGILVTDGVACDAATGVYSISTAEGMFWFANEVNVNKNSFSGKTIQLAADIDLENAVWEPVGQTGNMTFYGTFDGNGKTISNLYVEAQATNEAGANYASGLFGWVENHASSNVVIKDLTVSGANINGHHYVGAIAGYLVGVTIQNCTVTGSTVTATHANDDACGDKVGGIAGYDGAKNTVSITGCTVTNSAVYASRDAGQILGAGYDGISVTDCTVSEVTVAEVADDTCTHTNKGGNINARPIGRHL